MLSFLNKKVQSVFILKNIMLNGYGNQNNKKSIFTVGLISKTTTSFALRHTFLYISLPLLFQENKVKLPTYTFLSLIKNNEKFHQANAKARRVCCKWIHPWYVLTTKFICAHQKKSVACGHVHFFFCTAAHFHFAGVAIAFLIFLPPLKKYSCCFFSTKSVSLVFSSRFSSAPSRLSTSVYVDTAL